MNESLKKELYVALHGQTVRFRIIKYAILVPLFGVIYWWKGWEITWKILGVALVFAIATHFFFRWKSKGWNESWGPYKPPEGLPK